LTEDPVGIEGEILDKREQASADLLRGMQGQLRLTHQICREAELPEEVVF
jgi:hypothetical protein